MAEAVAKACSRKERPHTLGGAVKAIAEDPFDLGQRLVLRGRALKRAMGRSQGHCTRLLECAFWRGIASCKEVNA